MFPVLWPVNYSHPAVQGGVKCCVITSPEPDTHAHTRTHTERLGMCGWACERHFLVIWNLNVQIWIYSLISQYTQCRPQLSLVCTFIYRIVTDIVHLGVSSVLIFAFCFLSFFIALCILLSCTCWCNTQISCVGFIKSYRNVGTKFFLLYFLFHFLCALATFPLPSKLLEIGMNWTEREEKKGKEREIKREGNEQCVSYLWHILLLRHSSRWLWKRKNTHRLHQIITILNTGTCPVSCFPHPSTPSFCS